MKTPLMGFITAPIQAIAAPALGAGAVVPVCNGTLEAAATAMGAVAVAGIAWKLGRLIAGGRKATGEQQPAPARDPIAEALRDYPEVIRKRLPEECRGAADVCSSTLGAAVEALPLVMHEAPTPDAAADLLGGIAGQCATFTSTVYDDLYAMLGVLPLQRIPDVMGNLVRNGAFEAITGIAHTLKGLMEWGDPHRRADLLEALGSTCGKKTNRAYLHLAPTAKAADGFIEDVDIVDLCGLISRECGIKAHVAYAQLASTIDLLRAHGMSPAESKKFIEDIVRICNNLAGNALHVLPDLLKRRGPSEIVGLMTRIRGLALAEAPHAIAISILPALLARKWYGPKVTAERKDDDIVRLLRQSAEMSAPYAETSLRQLPALVKVVSHERIPKLFERAMWADRYAKPLAVGCVARIVNATKEIEKPEKTMDDMMMLIARTMWCPDFWRRGRALHLFVEILEKNPRVSSMRWWSSTMGRNDVDAVLAIEMLFETMRNTTH